MNQSLLTGIRDLILSARRQVAQAINAGLTMLYWEIGRRIRQDILEENRAAYGEEIVSALRGQLGWTPIEDMQLTLDQAKTRVDQLIEQTVQS